MRSRTAGGSLTARVLGVIPVAGARGPETDKGEALRGLAELPWRPFAFREGQGFSWEAMAASMTLDQCWSISETWYEGRLDVDYERPPADHFQALLRGAGLVAIPGRCRLCRRRSLVVVHGSLAEDPTLRRW